MTIERRRTRSAPPPRQPGVPAFVPIRTQPGQSRNVGVITAGAAVTLACAWPMWHRVVSMATLAPAARLIATLLDPQPGMSAYDPGFGSGRLLRAMERHARVRTGDCRSSTALRLFGQELDPVAFAAGAAVLAASGMDATIALGDSLHASAFLNPDGTPTKFDRVAMNPTWEQPIDQAVMGSEIDISWPFGPPPLDCADWAWVQRGLAVLAPSGRMAVVLDAGALSRPGERHIRSAIVEADLLESVIVCHSNVPTSSPLARIVSGFLRRAAILVFDGEKRHPGEIAMIDAAEVVADHPLDIEGLIQSTSRLARRWRSKPGVVAFADRDAVALRRFDLRPEFYLSTQPSTPFVR